MTKLPSNPEKKIGSPQVVARLIKMDGMQVLVRLQKPFEEPNEDMPEADWLRYGTALICEVWSDSTKSVITEGIKRPHDQTEEAFQFGVRYMMNHSTDEELIHVLKIKGVHTRLRFQCGLDDTKVVLPVPPRLEKKKPT